MTPMLYDSDYNHLFEGEVNVEPSDFEEEEKKMEEEKTFGERVKEFCEKHPYLFLAGCAATGWLLGTFLKGIATKNYNRGKHDGFSDGWNMCTKYFDDLESVVRKELLTKELNS